MVLRTESLASSWRVRSAAPRREVRGRVLTTAEVFRAAWAVEAAAAAAARPSLIALRRSMHFLPAATVASSPARSSHPSRGNLSGRGLMSNTWDRARGYGARPGSRGRQQDVVLQLPRKSGSRLGARPALVAGWG